MNTRRLLTSVFLAIMVVLAACQPSVTTTAPTQTPSDSGNAAPTSPSTTEPTSPPAVEPTATEAMEEIP